MSAGMDELRIVTQGFWLPVGRSNFFDPDQDDQLFASYNAYNESRNGPLQGSRFDEIEIGTRKLEASVYRRLATVLPSGLRNRGGANLAPNGKRYSRIFPMFTATLQRLGLDSDVDAAAYVCVHDDLAQIPEWHDAWTYTEGVALVTVADGFYVWLALYQGAADHVEDRERKRRVEQALRAHIVDLVGGTFSNRWANRKDSPDYVAVPDSATLETYRDEDLGILSFYQINLIFEGLFNYSLDPRVFFDDGSDAPKVEETKHYYSLGRFIGMITTVAEVAPAKPENLSLVIEALHTLFDMPEDWDAQQYLDFFNNLRALCVNPKVRRDLLRQFLRRTSLETMHLLKLRIESCGRLLLSGMIKIAHLRQPFVQTEFPSTADIRTSRQARFNIVGANEGQLHGYVILLSAKLPLIENVWRYLEDNLMKLERLDKPSRATIAGLERSWRALLQSLKEDIHGLEQAIDQAYKNKMLSETEKFREEEETLAEIERIRERSGGDFSPSTNLTVNIIANVIAFAGVLIAVLVAEPQLRSLGPLLGDLQRQGIPAVAFAILVALCAAVVAAIVLYLVLHEISDPIIRAYTKHRSRRSRGDEQYYYEMDLRLDAVSSQTFATQLLSGAFSDERRVPGWDKLARRHRRLFPKVDRWHVWNWDHRPKRQSYRVNRSGTDEALHKLYVTAAIIWPRLILPAPWFVRDSMRVFLVYEVLFHSPSEAPTYVLKALRIVSTSDRVLSPNQLQELQLLILAEFVNRWIAEPTQMLTSSDALLSLAERS
jgi:hypothetical protein